MDVQPLLNWGETMLDSKNTIKSLSFALVLMFAIAPEISADFEQIRSLIRRGEFVAALQACDKDLRVNPRDFRILTLKGIALQGLGRNLESLEAFRQALKIQPKFLPALQGAAQLEYILHDPHCRQTLEAILKIQPEMPTAHAMLGVLSFEERDCKSTLEHFRKAGQISEMPPIKWRRAFCYYETESWAEAERDFVDLLNLKEDERVRYNLGLVRLKEGKSAEAITTLRPLLQKESPDPEVMSLLAASYEANKQTPEAFQILRRAIELYPYDEQLYVDLGILCLEHSSFLAGIEVLRIGVQNIPQSARIQIMLGIMQASAGFFAEAEKAFKKADQLSPNEAIGKVGLAIMMLHAGAADQVISLLREQIKRASIPLVELLLVEALLQKEEVTSNDLQEAKSLLLSSIKQQPTNAKAYTLLGKIYLREGNINDAVRALEKADRLDPSDRASIYQLMTLYNRLGRKQEAMDLMNRLRVIQESERIKESTSERYRLVLTPLAPNVTINDR